METLNIRPNKRIAILIFKVFSSSQPESYRPKQLSKLRAVVLHDCNILISKEINPSRIIFCGKELPCWENLCRKLVFGTDEGLILPHAKSHTQKQRGRDLRPRPQSIQSLNVQTANSMNALGGAIAAGPPVTPAYFEYSTDPSLAGALRTDLPPGI